MTLDSIKKKVIAERRVDGSSYNITEKTVYERIGLVTEIMTLAYLVHVHTDYCVFIDFSGHVTSLGIEIRESMDSWQKDVSSSKFYTDGRYEHIKDNKDDVNIWLKNKRDVLKEILETHEIPYESMTKNIEEIVEYHF